MKLLSLFTLVALGLSVYASDVTLFALDPASTDTLVSERFDGTVLGISPIAVDKSGATIYVASEVNSLIVLESAGVDQTLLSTPTTVTYTFRADASRYHLAASTSVSGVSGERTDDCTYAADGGMVCVVKVVAKADGKAATVATTVTGKQKPWYTITNVEALALPTSGARGLIRHGGVKGVAIVVAGLAIGVWLV